jgi:hypothetical protein
MLRPPLSLPTTAPLGLAHQRLALVARAHLPAYPAFRRDHHLGPNGFASPNGFAYLDRENYHLLYYIISIYIIHDSYFSNKVKTEAISLWHEDVLRYHQHLVIQLGISLSWVDDIIEFLVV